MVSQPLKDVRTPEEIEEYPWPVPEMILDLSGLAERARRFYRESPHAILGIHEGPSSIFEASWYLRGLPEFMMDLAEYYAMIHNMTDARLMLHCCGRGSY